MERQSNRRAIRVGLLRTSVSALAVSLVLAASTAPSASASIPGGFFAFVKSTVAPSKLPAESRAPVTLTITGNSAREADAKASLRSFTVQLDRRLRIDTEGLPVCPFSVEVLARYKPSYVKENCGAATVGTGTADWTIRFLEGPTDSVPLQMLLLNLRSGGLAMYRYIPAHPVHFENGEVETVPDAPAGAFPLGPGRTLNFANPEPVPNIPFATARFQFKLGRTWSYHGKRHSFLSASCINGSFKNRITLELQGMAPVSDASPQPCTTRR